MKHAAAVGAPTIASRAVAVAASAAPSLAVNVNWSVPERRARVGVRDRAGRLVHRRQRARWPARAATERVSGLPFASEHGSGTVAEPLNGTAAIAFEQAGRLAAQRARVAEQVQAEVAVGAGDVALASVA